MRVGDRQVLRKAHEGRGGSTLRTQIPDQQEMEGDQANAGGGVEECQANQGKEAKEEEGSLCFGVNKGVGRTREY